MKNFYQNWSVGDLKAEYSKKFKNRQMDDSMQDKTEFCSYFCPPREECIRRINDTVEPFETEILIKRFERSVAGNKLHNFSDTRDIDTLNDVVDYLLFGSYLSDLNMPIFKFIDNRLRSVKLDLEHLSAVLFDEMFVYKKIKILFKIVRFYAISIHAFYLVENDLHQIMEQLRKTLAILGRQFISNRISNDDLVIEYETYNLLANMDDNKINAKISGDKIFKEAFSTWKLFKRENFKKFLEASKQMNFMHYSISLYYMNKIKIRTIEIFKKGINEEIEVDALNRMVGYDVKGLLESFYYEINEGKVNLKIKNSRHKEIDKVILCRNNIIKVDYKELCRYGSNYVKFIYKEVIYKYINKQIERHNETIKIHKKVIREYINKIYQFFIYKKVVIKYTEKIRHDIKNKNRINAEIKFKLLKKALKEYAKMLIRRYIHMKYINSLIDKKVIIVGDNLTVEVPLIFDIKETNNFTLNDCVKYNCYVFITNDSEKVENKYYFINKKFYRNAEEMKLDMPEIISNAFRNKKRNKMLYSEISNEDKIEYLITNKSRMNFDVDEEIKAVMENRSTREMFVYK